MKTQFLVYRFDPASDEKPRYQSFTVEAEPTDKILDCLNKIRWDQDASLAFRASCAHGICGSDAMMINGDIGLACQKLVRDYKTGGHFVIEPLPIFEVVKDLVVDLEPFFEKYRAVKPYLVSSGEAPETERLQDPSDQATIEPALRCILCACCTASCPINRADADYLGPSALLRAFRYLYDSRDEAKESRLEGLNSEQGAWGCKTMRWCTDVCPKGIPITQCLTRIKSAIKKAGLP
ncbi:MAG: succinate dehydrogenase iron-sulfur subunit [Desulfobacterales bacterium]|jgi:succinate dehydrogenase / fumarate reductase iron-sulfur subunit